jgi:hypothetical protein
MAQTQCSAHDLAMDPLMPVPSPHQPRLIHALEKPNLHRLPRSRFVITIEQQLKTIRNVLEVF